MIKRARAGTHLSAKKNPPHSWSALKSLRNVVFQLFRIRWQTPWIKTISSIIRLITHKLIVRLTVKLIGLEIISVSANNCKRRRSAVLGITSSMYQAKNMVESYVTQPWSAWVIIISTIVRPGRRRPILGILKAITLSIRMRKQELESSTSTRSIRLTILTDSSMWVLRMPWSTLTSLSATKLNCRKTILDTCPWFSRIQWIGMQSAEL